VCVCERERDDLKIHRILRLIFLLKLTK